MTERIASLPMYDMPELRPVTDAWWSGLVRHFRAAGLNGIPENLTRPGEGPAFWRLPDLLLSQSCGYPVATVMADRVRIVATPCYIFPGCDGPRYSSVVVVSANAGFSQLADLRDMRCVINAPDSWSGYHALHQLSLSSGGGDPLVSGGHRASIAMVAGGEADFAAIDCVTWGLLSRHAPSAVAGVRVLDMTPSAPGLPLIAGPQVTDEDMSGLREGLHAAMADPALNDVRGSLGLTGLAELTLQDYLPLSTRTLSQSVANLRQPS